MPYLIQIGPFDAAPAEELFDDESRSIKQALNRLTSQPDAEELAGHTIRIWTVTGQARVFTAQPTIHFAGGTTNE